MWCGLIGQFAALVMYRCGVRGTMSLPLAATGIVVALSPAMHEVWQLILLWGVAVGLSTGFIGAYRAAVIASRWFRTGEGLVVGILTAANAAGQLIFLPTMAAIVSTAGWRVMSLVVAASVIVIVPVLALLMRERPEDLGLAPYGDMRGPRAVPQRSLAGNPVTAAVRALGERARTRHFLLITGSS